MKNINTIIRNINNLKIIIHNLCVNKIINVIAIDKTIVYVSNNIKALETLFSDDIQKNDYIEETVDMFKLFISQCILLKKNNEIENLSTHLQNTRV